jgi:pyridoxine 4-dehydrogenase
VLREAVKCGVTHIDTSDYYGPHIVNELIRDALHPYPKELHVVTKVGARRAADKSWPVALSREELTTAVHDNLKHLRLDTLDVVNLRVGDFDRPTPGSIAEPFSVLAALRQQGLIRHLGVSNVSAEQLTEAQSIAPVVCVQNNYNISSRHDSELVGRCAREGIAYTPYFPLGGFTPLQSAVLDAVASRLGAAPRQVALAWLLQHSPTILLIPGTSSVGHLRENIAAAAIKLPPDAIEELDRVGAR